MDNALPPEESLVSLAAKSTDALQLAHKLSKYKQHSLDISLNAHFPTLANIARSPKVVLLGDSMIERMTTTGKSPNLMPWPSESMIAEDTLKIMNYLRMSKRKDLQQKDLRSLPRLSGVFNAGCSGDKIENMLFRLVGDAGGRARPQGEKAETFSGLADALSLRKENKVLLWIVHAGTNNLHQKNGLTDASISALRVLLLSLLQTSAQGAHILLTGLFYRTDIADELVDEANGGFIPYYLDKRYGMIH